MSNLITRPNLIAAKAYVATLASFLSVFLTAVIAAPELDVKAVLQGLAAALALGGVTGGLTYQIPNTDLDDPSRNVEDEADDGLPDGAVPVSDDETDDYPSPVATPGAQL